MVVNVDVSRRFWADDERACWMERTVQLLDAWRGRQVYHDDVTKIAMESAKSRLLPHVEASLCYGHAALFSVVEGERHNSGVCIPINFKEVDFCTMDA